MDGVSLKDVKVGVLMGGVSPEREISLVSGRDAASALIRRGICIEKIDILTSNYKAAKDLIARKRIDVAFIALHGEFGEDGGIQAILEEMAIPYTGSGPGASALAMNKISSKELFIRSKIPTPCFFVTHINALTSLRIDFPKVVKPYCSGSSLGVSIVRNKEELAGKLDKALSVNKKVLIEDYIFGRELTVGILDDRPLSVVEIIPRRGYYDFNAKYTEGLVDFVSPADLQSSVYQKVMDIAHKAHICLGCRHFSRVDIRLDERGVPFVLEVNSIPGLTSHSLLPLSAKACGIGFDNLITGMLKSALKDLKKADQKV